MKPETFQEHIFRKEITLQLKHAENLMGDSNAHFQDRDSRNQFQISLVFLMNNTSPCKEKENLHGKYNGEKDTYVQTSYFMS